MISYTEWQPNTLGSGIGSTGDRWPRLDGISRRWAVGSWLSTTSASPTASKCGALRTNMDNSSALVAVLAGTSTQDDPWEQQIRASDRPDDLKTLMIALSTQVASLYGPSSGHRVVGFKASPIGGGSAQAELLTEGMFQRLERSRQRAARVIRNKSVDLAAKLASYVTLKTGYAGNLSADLAKANFVNRVERYLESGVNDLRPYASSAVQSWLSSNGNVQALRDLLAPVIGRAAAQAQMVVRTEMQNAYVDLVREAMSGKTTIERLVAPGACALCKARAGVQPYSEDALWTHPNCACTFRTVGVVGQDTPALFHGWPVVVINV